jgi:AcrR family transcriptional regulator
MGRQGQLSAPLREGPTSTLTTIRPTANGQPPVDSDVATKQTRMLNAFMMRVAELGYPKAHVEDVCKDVSLSTRDFYLWFGAKDRCFLWLFSTLGQQVIQQSEREYRRVEGPWEVKMRAALEVATRQLAAYPRIVRFLGECQHVERGRDALWQLITSAQPLYLTQEVRE